MRGPLPSDEWNRAICLHDADTGEQLDVLPVAPRDYEGSRSIAISGRYLAIASGNLYGNGRVWGFAR